MYRPNQNRQNNSAYTDGIIAVSAGGKSKDAHLAMGGFMQVESGGIAENTGVMYDAILGVAPGGVVKNTSLGIGGVMGVSSGGVASGTDIEHGFMEISSGGSASNTEVAGGLVINRGGTAQFSVLEDGSPIVLSGIGIRSVKLLCKSLIKNSVNK